MMFSLFLQKHGDQQGWKMRRKKW